MENERKDEDYNKRYLGYTLTELCEYGTRDEEREEKRKGVRQKGTGGPCPK